MKKVIDHSCLPSIWDKLKCIIEIISDDIVALTMLWHCYGTGAS